MSNLRQQLILRHVMLRILSPLKWPRRRYTGSDSELTYQASERRVHQLQCSHRLPSQA